MPQADVRIDDGLEDGLRLVQDRVFKDGLVSDKSVHGAEARGNLRIGDPVDYVFVCDEAAAGFADRGGDGIPLVRAEGADVDQDSAQRRSGTYRVNELKISSACRSLTYGWPLTIAL